MKRIILIIVGICFAMLLDAQVSKTATVSAGNLSTALTATELSTVTNLTLTGTIDARDFKTMRDNMPVLAVLNLSGVNVLAYSGSDGSQTGLNTTYLANWIPNNAFCINGTGKPSLTNITFPLTITSIGREAFTFCSNLSAISAIQATVTYIEPNAFEACYGLITVDVNNPNYSSKDGLLFNKLQTLLLQCPTSKAGNYSIPISVTSVNSFSFVSCNQLTSVTIPSTVVSIGEGAFRTCGGLITVDAGNPNYSAESGVLFNKLKTNLIQYPTSKTGGYVIPSSVTSIGDGAFMWCSNLTSVLIPEVTSIGSVAFRGCSSLSQVKIPSSVTSIGAMSFSYCSSLTSLYSFKTTPVDLNSSLYVFSNFDKTPCTLYVPYGTSSSYRAANQWKDFANIVEMVQPEMTSTISPSAICSGTIFSYTPTSTVAETTFAWSRAVVAGISNPVGSGTGNPNEALVNLSSSPITVTYVYILAANGITKTYNITVVVNPTPGLTSTLSPPAICSGSIFSYSPSSSTPGTTFAWSRAAVAGISNTSRSGIGNPNEDLINTTAYSVNVTYAYTLTANACVSLHNVVVAVNPRASIASVSGTSSLCMGASATYITMGAVLGGGSGTWSSSNVTVANVHPATGLVNAIGPGTCNIIYTIKGCFNETISSQQTLTVNSIAAPISSGDIMVCETTPIQTLTAAVRVPAAGETITWYDAPTGGTAVAIPILSNVGAKIFYAESRNSSCSSLTRTPVTLIINSAPPAPVSLGDKTICDTTPVIVLKADDQIAAQGLGTSVSWYSTAVGGAKITNSTFGNIGTVTYYAEAKRDSTSCSSLTRTRVNLTINATPAKPVTLGDIVEYAKNPLQTLTAAATASSGATIQWYTTLTGVSPLTTPTLNTVGTVAYYVEARLGTCTSSGPRPSVRLTIIPSPTVTDVDGNAYSTVTIGNQIWMGANLKVTKYNDGTVIPLIIDNTTWLNLTTPGYCWYNNDEVTNKNTYGALYNWYTVNTGKLCPTGWHVPTDAEWTVLSTYLGGESVAGGKLKEAVSSHWLTPNTGATNETGFTAVPGGYSVGISKYIGSYGYWWSSSEDGPYYVWSRYMSYDFSTVNRSLYGKEKGFSVRCLQNSQPTVSTTDISNIMQASATCGGNITYDGGATVTARGVCWSTSPNPTISNSKTTNGTGAGVFSASITGLTAATTYYVKAYATNSVGTAYGNQVTFTTYTNTQANAGPDVTICAGTNYTFTGAVAANFLSLTWATNGTGTFTNYNTLTPNYFPSSADLASGSVVLTLSCYSTAPAPVSDSMVLSFLKTPTTSGSITGLTLVYQGASGLYSTPAISNAISYFWSYSGTGATITGTTNTVTVSFSSTASSGNLSVRGLNACGSGTTSSFTISVIPSSATVTDVDGNAYSTVTIGNQIWMGANLKTTKYNDGTAIPLVTSNTSWANLVTPGYSWYNNDEAANKDAYGALYNWKAVDTGKLCPMGWHVPTDAQWTTLTNYLGGRDVAGRKLKEAGSSHWLSPNTGATNETGFTAIPGGIRLADGAFASMGNYGYWWSSTSNTAIEAWLSGMHYNYEVLSRLSYTKLSGFSVRCLQDSLAIPTISTTVVSNIAPTTASSGGNITSDGGAAITARGVCWSTSPNPTISNSKITNGTGAGVFSASITGLTTATTYYVKAFATNSVGTAYGNQVSFATSDFPNCGKVTDIDGNVYNTVTIGSQCWMVENLKTTKYNDGTAIPNIANNSWASLSSGAYCWYNHNSSANKDKYGALYNFYAVNTNKLAPKGWHVPTAAEFNELFNYLISNGYNFDGTTQGNKFAKALAAASLWNSSAGSAGTPGNPDYPAYINKSGFSALPAGGYDGTTFYQLGSYAYLWSSSDGGSTVFANRLYMINYSVNVYVNIDPKYWGFSVRCLKGDPIAALPALSTISVATPTPTSAASGGDITSDGGAAVTSRGVCWSTTPTPTIANSKTADGTGISGFKSSITGLTANTTYYLRAYATNSAGTAYGNELTFKTTDFLNCGTVTDVDGNVYHTVTIGTQCWMVENLKTTKYNDGTAIPNSTDDGSWTTLKTGAYCFYNNDITNKNIYGALYNWYAVNTNKLAPKGWRVATNQDWNTLATYLGGDSLAGMKIKETGTVHWLNPNLGATNESGFTSLPGGYRMHVANGFAKIGYNATWWCPEQIDSNTAITRYQDQGPGYYRFYLDRGMANKNDGFTIRCVSETPNAANIPVLSSTEPTNITSMPVIAGGIITSDGGAPVTSKGICWSTTQNPTIANSKTSDGTGTGTFTSYIIGLTENTTYYVRAYATNSAGTGYGNQVSFKSGDFSPRFTKQPGIALTPVAYPIGKVANWIDYNNDGLLDIYISGSTTTGGCPGFSGIYTNNGNNTFTPLAGLPFSSFHAMSVDWCDFNNDGFIDVIMSGEATTTSCSNSVKIFKNNGNGTFSQLLDLPVTGIISVVDYNNDGKMDFSLFVGDNPAALRMYRNNGDGTFTLDTNITFPSFAHSSVASFVDFNKDGFYDLFLCGNDNSNNGQYSLYKNNGNSTFSQVPNFSSNNKSNWTVSWADYNNDGYLDYIKGDSAVYINNSGNGTFTRNNISMRKTLGYNEWGDYNNDGKPDMLVGGWVFPPDLNVTSVYKNNGSYSFNATSDTITGTAQWSSLKWGDYDNDGYLDILVTGYTKYSPYKCAEVYKSSGGSFPNTPPASPTNLSSVVNGNSTSLTWNAATDNQTPANSLTYNVRIGTTKGGQNIVNPLANVSNGFRRNPANGNAGTNLNFIIKGLSPGTYYWSVQAIDNGYKGGNFASEGSFTVTDGIPGPAGPIAGTEYICTVSKNSIAWANYSVPVIPNATGYVWSLPVGGKIYSGNNTNFIEVHYSDSTISGNVTVKGINSLGSGGISSMAFNVKSIPVATIKGDSVVCAGSTLYTYTTEPGMTGYNWGVSTGDSIPGTANTNQYSVRWTTPGIQTISVIYGQPPNGCSMYTPAVKSVFVRELPVVTNAGSYTINSGSGPNISLTATTASTFFWTIGAITGGITGASSGSGSIINQILTIPSNTTSGTVIYYVTPTSTSGSCLGKAYPIIVLVKSASHFQKVWTGNGTNHQNIYAVLAKMDSLNLEAGDEVGIFDGTKCVGVGLLTGTVSSSNVLQMVVSQDNGSENGFIAGNSISFKFFDKSQNKEIANVTAKYLSTDPKWNTSAKFVVGATSLIELTGFTIIRQSIALASGWNIISSYLTPANTDLKPIFQSLIDSSLLTKILDETGKSIENFGAFGGWKNNIGNWAATEGYKVNVVAPCSLTIEGFSVPLPLDIPLIAGWNIIAYPCSTIRDAKVLIQPLIDSGKLIKVIDETGKTIEDFGAFGGWKNNIGNFIPGKGYKVNVSENCTLTVSASANKSATIVPEVMASTHFVSVFSGNGTDHMNISILDLTSSGLQAGDQIGIFDGNYCVGAATISTEQLMAGSISIPSSSKDGLASEVNGFTSGNRIELQLYRSNQIYQLEKVILRGNDSFTKNGSLFVKVAAKGLPAASMTDGKDQLKCYPNPFSDQLTIEIRLTEPKKLEVSIYDLSGKLIRSLYKSQAGTSQTLVWDGRNGGGAKVTSGTYMLKANGMVEKIVLKK